MTEAGAIGAAIDALERVFDDALLVALPNPVPLTFTELVLGYQGKRDLLWALDVLNEGENEAALIAGLAHERLRERPDADASHLAREAAYYLRTSIDPTWQFDDAPPSLVAVLRYLATVVRERAAALRARPHPGWSDVAPTSDRRELLTALAATRR